MLECLSVEKGGGKYVRNPFFPSIAQGGCPSEF